MNNVRKGAHFSFKHFLAIWTDFVEEKIHNFQITFVLRNRKWIDLIVNMHSGRITRTIVSLFNMRWKSYCCCIRWFWWSTWCKYVELCAVFKSRSTFHFRNSIDFIAYCLQLYNLFDTYILNMLIYYLNIHTYALCLPFPIGFVQNYYIITEMSGAYISYSVCMCCSSYYTNWRAFQMENLKCTQYKCCACIFTSN